MRIGIVGTGYVGLVTGTCFAEIGIDTVCIDVDASKIELMKQGKSPIYERGLEEMMQNNIAKGRLHFTTSLPEVLNSLDIVFIAVGTPPDEDGSADLTHVLNVARTIGQHLERNIYVVNKSTVPVGTGHKVKQVILEELQKRYRTYHVEIISNPEFLKEGDAINDFMKPDRIVVGVESESAREIMAKLYKPFTLNGHPIIFMDILSAELTKYAANAMLATRISFMNEIAALCDRVGADVNMVRRGIGSDPRIGNKFLYSGVGYGGSCFPKDVKALIKTGIEYGYQFQILQAVENVNEKQKEILVEKLKKFWPDLNKKRIAIWGLSFKPNTDDMREAPSLRIINRLIQEGAEIVAYDPVAINEAKRRLGDKIQYATDMYSAVNDTDALLLVTEWTEFRYPNWNDILRRMRRPLILDGRNIYDAHELKKYGFEVDNIGAAK
ncbi:MAG: UDP-glucose/GDP-mannose dehydrogenase family protein [Bacteroidales bacterium]|nr:UDP-glucose/GDP-mannose dehydrogenase family protein [Bacteroidales bacterium]